MDIHLLMSLAAAGAIAIGDYTEAAAVVVLFAVAEHWERCSTEKARNAVAAVLNLRPESGQISRRSCFVAVGVLQGWLVLADLMQLGHALGHALQHCCLRLRPLGRVL